ncbi:hypothetical protein [uncultured Chryseobacterium sp.]|uniref:hypothetical protein n=1 Tax=uncultured Chryseobacterium sp. TaxID=259322 RepID=UPI0025EC6BA3|nr:hypothetical protein [uncultured Chryseobacterium sp.]
MFVITDNNPKTNAKQNHEKEAENTVGKKQETINFEKVEVVKGASDMGYTAVAPIKEIAADIKNAIKGTYFINAKLTNSGEHEH